MKNYLKKSLKTLYFRFKLLNLRPLKNTNMYTAKIRHFFVKCVFAILMIYSTPCLAQNNYGNYNNFLPMEDALSATRNSAEFHTNIQKPYRQSYNLGSQKIQNKSYVDFTTMDIFAFILLGGIYLMFVRSNSKSRNATF